jgi:putative membrane protein
VSAEPVEATGATDSEAVDAAPTPPPSQGIASPDAWLRLSPRALGIRPITDLLRSAPVLVGLLYEGTRGGQSNYWGICFGAFAIIAGIWRWLGTKYQVTEDRVYIKRGLLSPRVLSTPRSGVRSVDLTAHVMYRLLGLARVKIGTGRNDKHEGEHFNLDALAVADAEALRTLLLAGSARSAAPARPACLAAAAGSATSAGSAGSGESPESATPSASAASPPETEIVRLRASWIRFAPLTLTGLVILGVLIGFVSQFEHDAGLDRFAFGPVHSGIRDVKRMPLGESIPVGVLVIALGLAFVSVLGYVAVFWRFRLVRTNLGSLRVTRGLLSTRATTIDESRLRGVEISEPLSLRAANGARCIAITTGLRAGGGSERGGSVLLPPAPRAVAERVTAEILGVPAELASVGLIPHGEAARRRRTRRAVIPILAGYLVAATTLAELGVRSLVWTAVLLALTWMLGILLGRDRYRGLGHRITGDWIVLGTGSLVRRRSIVNVHGVIGWKLRQTWLQRRSGLVTVTAATAAGKQRYSVADMPMADALAFITAATPDLVPPFLTAHPGDAA